MGIKISVITPTYNRGHLLTRCYDSLCEQEFNAFEWIIIDDGSSDDTKNVVKSFLKDGKVHIRYIYQANRGKHIAHNVGGNYVYAWILMIILARMHFHVYGHYGHLRVKII